MKKMLIITAAISLLLVSCNKNNYVVSGEIYDLNEGQITLSTVHSENPYTETVDIKNGKFTFKGSLLNEDGSKGGRAQIVALKIEGQESTLNLFLVNGSKTEIIVAEAAKLYEAEISSDNDLMNSVLILEKDINIYTETVKSEYQTMTTKLESPELTAEDKIAGEMEINALLEEYQKHIATLQNDYISANPNSDYTPYIVLSKISEYSLDELEATISRLETVEGMTNNVYFTRLKTLYNGLKAVADGSVAPDFVQNDVDGNPVSLSSVYTKGKITMIDFWASWCGPCRKFNPTLVEIYKKYHDKGLEIIGVSCDDNKEKWLAAIEKDGLTWTHVSDLKGWENAVAQTFVIRYIPQNVFVDNNGVIIAKQVSEEEIDAFIAKYLQSK